MKRVSYVDLLENLRRREHGSEVESVAARVTAPHRRDATKTLVVRLTPEQKAFLRSAAKRAHAGSVDESAIVAVAVSVVEALEVPWESISSKEVLVDAVRRRLRAH